MNLDYIDYICIFFGLMFLGTGIYTIWKKEYTHSTNSFWGPSFSIKDVTHTDTSAMQHGIFQLLLGIIILGVYLAESLGYIDTASIRQFIKDVLIDAE